MHPYHLPNHDPASMSARARGYLTVAFLHFGIIGVDILAFPQHYSAPAYTAIISAGYGIWWGVGYGFVSAVCLVALLTRWPSLARIGLTAAFVVLLLSAFAVGWGVVGAWLDGADVQASAVVPVTLAAIAAKDLLMVGQPLRTPTEDQTKARHDLDGAGGAAR